MLHTIGAEASDAEDSEDSARSERAGIAQLLDAEAGCEPGVGQRSELFWFEIEALVDFDEVLLWHWQVFAIATVGTEARPSVVNADVGVAVLAVSRLAARLQDPNGRYSTSIVSNVCDLADLLLHQLDLSTYARAHRMRKRR